MKNYLLSALIATFLFQGLFAQQTNNALNFQNGDYINIDNISNTFNNINQFTVEFWVKFDAQDNTDHSVFYSINSNDYDNRMIVRFAGPFDNINDAAVVFIKDNNGNENFIRGTTRIGDNKCHHIAFTYENSVCSLYVDGNLEATGNHALSILPTDLHSLGQEYDPTLNPNSQFYTGEMDDFRIWNFAKSETDIIAGKDNELNGNESGLLVYYDFNQGTPAGNNTSIIGLENSVNPTLPGTFNNLSLNGSTSNFVDASCPGRIAEIEKNVILDTYIISPNPTDGKINISNYKNISRLKLINSLGKIVMDVNASPTIDLSNLTNGIYFLMITENNGNVTSVKVLKN